ncbi:MAG TPA: type IV pilus assembly protein PilM [Patescibacteria group bacterium]|nr:type IV pilus assembly protein PilM [Patescibacteria group bacterium]
MNKIPFGLDIGASTIKVVWLEGKTDAFVLKAAAMVPTPPKGMLSESPLDEEEMSRAVQKAVTSANIDSKQVNVALAENQVYTKVLEMPVLSDRELRSAIYWEAEQYIPVPLTNVTLTWNVLDRPAKPVSTDKMVVLMVGAPTTLVTKYQKIITMAGLTINSMETEILATVRSLVLGENFPPSIIVSIGAVSTSFAIIRNGVMVFTYSMSVGGSAINHAIASDFGFTPDQAEEYKKVYGVSDKALGGKIGQATTPILNAIVVEVKKSLAYYAQKYKDLPIRQIILVGGTANLPGIDLFFANNSGVETVVANPWKVLAPTQIPQEILQNGVDYTIAVGLAMRSNE